MFLVDPAELTLTQDYEFSSPSQAAAMLLARSANGRTEWKDAKGVTLKEHQERTSQVASAEGEG